jgi:hypothetical protein
MATETPQYTTLESEGQFALRKYSSYLVAETEIEGQFDEVSTIGFKRLAAYIFGDNVGVHEATSEISSQKKPEMIAMTTPVGLEARAGKYVVTFSMPSSYTLTTLPVPNDKTVVIKSLPERTCAVIEFSGTCGETHYRAYLNELNDWIAARNLKKLSEPIFARYNPPWTLPFLRRNEILIPVKSSD